MEITRPAQSKISSEATSRSQIPLVCRVTALRSSVPGKCVYLCVWQRQRKGKKKARENLWWFMKSRLGVYFWSGCVCVCESLGEKSFQRPAYDTPFTSGGPSCLSFFIPRSLMGLWWWWRVGPSPPALMPPWDEEGPPPLPRPPEECCTLRSLLPSTRICRSKNNNPVLHVTARSRGEQDVHARHQRTGSSKSGKQ